MANAILKLALSITLNTTIIIINVSLNIQVSKTGDIKREDPEKFSKMTNGKLRRRSTHKITSVLGKALPLHYACDCRKLA